MAERSISAAESELINKARKFLPGGSLGNISRDIVISEGKGSRVRDVSGNEYIDYLLGSGPMLIGHAHPEVLEAVQEQIQKGTTFFANNDQAILLAEELVRAVPCGDMVRFSSSGTEATLYALRAARAYRRRDKILKFEGGYHGMHDYALMSMSPANPQDFPRPTPDSPGIPQSIQDEVLIAPFNDLDAATALIEARHDELGAVIVEPFQRLLPPKPGFLAGLREVTAQYGVPLIFDEVVTGFRFAYGGAQEYYGVTPDLCSLGKVIAGGFPLSAVAGKEEFMAQFDGASAEPGGFLPQIGTLSGNPVAAAAGLKTLEILRREGTYERLFATGKRLKDELQRILDEAELPANVTGEPPLFDVYFTRNEIADYRSTLAADKRLMAKFNEHMLSNGILKGDSKFYVSIAHTAEDVQQTIDAFAAAADELKR